MTFKKLTAVALAATAALAVASCSSDKDDEAAAQSSIDARVSAIQNPEPAAGIQGHYVPTYALPFADITGKMLGVSAVSVTCPDGGYGEWTRPAFGERVVRPDAEVARQEIGSSGVSYPVENPTAVLQVVPRSGSCHVEARNGDAASLGEYDVTERTIFTTYLEGK